jgi:hypothetical protein
LASLLEQVQKVVRTHREEATAEHMNEHTTGVLVTKGLAEVPVELLERCIAECVVTSGGKVACAALSRCNAREFTIAQPQVAPQAEVRKAESDEPKDGHEAPLQDRIEGKSGGGKSERKADDKEEDSGEEDGGEEDGGEEEEDDQHSMNHFALLGFSDSDSDSDSN